MWWIVAAIAAIALVGAIWRGMRRSPGRQERGLKILAKQISGNPIFGRAMSRSLSTRAELLDAAKNAPPPAQEDIPRLVRELLDSDEDTHDAAEIRLRKVIDTAAPQLLDALTHSPRIWTREDRSELASAPADRIFYLLWETHPRELGERIGHLWDDSDWRVYTKAIKSRAALGRADLARWLFDLLRDQSHENASMRREKAIEGTEVAIQRGWIERDLLDALLVWARDNVTDTSQRPEKWAIQLLSRHDKDQAMTLFMSDRVLSLNNNRNIHFVLEELDRQGVVLDSSMARAMVEKSLLAKEWPWDCTFGYAVQALFRICPDEAIRLAESMISDTRKSYGVLKFLFEARNLPRVFELTPPEDFALTEDEKRILSDFHTIIEASGEIGNGGLSQYFFNSSGDNWRKAVASFRNIGFVRGAEALERAAFIVDSKGAATDRETRIAQYAGLSEEQEAELDDLSATFYGAASDAAEYRYMVQHLDLFQRIRRARIAAGMNSRNSR